MKDESKICSICQSEYTEWGNNAEPVNDGRCCNTCNNTVVLTARLNMMRRHGKTNVVKFIPKDGIP